MQGLLTSGERIAGPAGLSTGCIRSLSIAGDTIADVAAVVDAHYQAWRVIGAAIEQARLGAKAAVDAAETVEDAQSAYESVTWPVG